MSPARCRIQDSGVPAQTRWRLSPQMHNGRVFPMATPGGRQITPLCAPQRMGAEIPAATPNGGSSAWGFIARLTQSGAAGGLVCPVLQWAGVSGPAGCRDWRCGMGDTGTAAGEAAANRELRTRTNREHADDHAYRAWAAEDITWGVFNGRERRRGAAMPGNALVPAIRSCRNNSATRTVSLARLQPR